MPKFKNMLTKLGVYIDNSLTWKTRINNDLVSFLQKNTALSLLCFN